MTFGEIVKPKRSCLDETIAVFSICFSSAFPVVLEFSQYGVVVVCHVSKRIYAVRRFSFRYDKEERVKP